MSLFVIADTHLSFASNKPMDIFGDRWKNHAEKLSSRWKSLVTDSDTVIIPGDISWAMSLEEAVKDLKFIDLLPGRKIILKGNHDYWWSTAKKISETFEKNNLRSISLLHNNSDYAEGFAVCGTRGWYTDSNSPCGVDYHKIILRESGRLRMSLEDAEKKYPGIKKLAFFHFPPVFEKFVCNEFLDILKEFNVRQCFFGHIHGCYDLPHEYEYDGIIFRLISSDFLNFYPYPVK